MALRMRAVWRAARQLELRVHGADHQVELASTSVRQVERAVFEDVDLNALEYGNALQASRSARRCPHLPAQPFDVQALGHGQPA